MQLPARIGKYELQEFLGGGMSHVYRSQDTVLGRTVAVKILTEQGCSDAEAKARFLQEARVASSIVHENIMNVFDFGEEGGKPYIVMDVWGMISADIGVFIHGPPIFIRAPRPRT